MFCATTFCLISPARSLDLSIDDVLNLVFKNPDDANERIVATDKLVAFLEGPQDKFNVITVTLVESDERGFLFDDTYFSGFATAYLVKQDTLLVRVKPLDSKFDRLRDWTQAADINVYTGYTTIPVTPRADQAVDITGSCALVVTLAGGYSVEKVDSYVLGGDADPLKMQQKVMECFAASFLRFAGVQSVDPQKAVKRYESSLDAASEFYGLTHEYDVVLRLAMEAVLRPGMTRQEAAAALRNNPKFLPPK
jgi:hypothetical protein